MRISFKRVDRSRLPMSAGPAGWDIRVDGKTVGGIGALGGGAFNGPFRGWYFSVSECPELGLPYKNTCNAPGLEEDEAKQEARNHIKKHYKASK